MPLLPVLTVHTDLDIISMYESAWKQQPGNEDLGAQTFSANARTGNWKMAQQVYLMFMSEVHPPIQTFT